MTRIANWAGNIAFSTGTLHRPRTVEQLQDLVSASPSIRALGTGHSFNRIADTTGALVTVADLDTKTELDEAARTVTVGAGTTYGELAAYLQIRGWALHNLGSLPHITVGGACATGTHGSGDRNGCLATAVVATEFVRGDGELVRIDRGDDTFPGVVLSLGALGVTTRLTLAIEPTYDLRQDVWLGADLDSVIAHLDEVMAAGHSVSLFTRFDRAGVLDQIWFKAGADAPVTDGARFGARPAETAQHPIMTADASTSTPQLGEPGAWNTRLPHFRLEFTPSAGDEQQSEYFVPRRHGAAALDAVRSLDLHPALMVCEVRTVAADALWLSPFRERDTLALHFTWVNDDDLVGTALTQVEQALSGFEARPHWAKVFRTSPEDLAAIHSGLPRFRELVAAHDPQRRFGNAFLETFVY